MELKKLGCICCRKRGLLRETQVHHLVEARKRLGNDATIPLCDYHHMGYRYSKFAQPGAWTRPETVQRLGPALADNKRLFTAEFGTERQLVKEVNELLATLETLPFEMEVYG